MPVFIITSTNMKIKAIIIALALTPVLARAENPKDEFNPITTGEIGRAHV